MVNKVKNILKQLKKIWDLKEDKDELKEIMIEKLLEKDKELPKEEWIGFMGISSILMFIPKKKKLRKLIENNFEADGKKETPSLIKRFNYTPKNFEEIECLYSEEVLNIIFNLTKGYEKIKIKMKKDYPLWVEVEDFVFILAPRIEDEEKNKNYFKQFKKK